MQKITLFLSLLVLTLPFAAEASPKPWYWSWWPSHWDGQKFQPHLMDPKTPHNAQWRAKWSPEEGWTPENWINAEGSIDAVLKNFYDAGIIIEQTDDDNVPVLVVGDGYMNLSSQEKIRVAEFIDYVYGITAQPDNALFYIYYDRTKKLWWRGEPIGVYTANGLQLQ